MKQIKNPVGDGGDRIPRLMVARDFGFLILDVVLDIGGVSQCLLWRVMLPMFNFYLPTCKVPLHFDGIRAKVPLHFDRICYKVPLHFDGICYKVPLHFAWISTKVPLHFDK